MPNRKMFTPQKRKIVYDKFNGHCAYCGCKIEFGGFVVDHFLAVAKGGKNNIDNLFPSCELCNAKKFDLGIEDFRKELCNLPNENYPKLKILKKYYYIRPKRNNFLFYFETFGGGENKNG